MEHNLNWKQSLDIDESIKRFEYREYEPYSGHDLNKLGDIRIMIQNQDEFLLPSRSYIYIEGSLVKEDGKAFEKDQPGNMKDLYINLINNGIMYLFRRVDYQLGNENIEGYSNPGQASTIKGLITYPRDYIEGMNFMWVAEKGSGCIKNNDSYDERHNYLFKDKGSGNFSVAIPLSNMFGFCENYDKVIYGIKHQLTLTRKDDKDAILKSNDKNDDGSFKVPDGKIILSKIIWRIPHVTLTDKYMIKLYNDIQNKIVLNINFLNRQCESIEINEDQRQFDWRLNVTAGAEKPRFIILAFQENKEDNELMNPSLFSHCDISNALVELNGGERYPEMGLQLDFNKNNYTTAYKMLTDYFNYVLQKENCSITLTEYRNLYPLLVFDVSRQSEKLKNSVTDIKIKVDFRKNISKGTKAYALVLSDRILKLESDGNKMNFVY